MTFPETLGGVPLGQAHPPVVVAEMSANHNGSLQRAIAIIDAVAEAGAQMVKFQSYRADTLTIDVDRPEFRISKGHALWGGTNLYRLYEQAHTPFEWHAELFAHARDRGLTPFSSPFDPTAVELLESLGCPVYKIASSEIVDLPLVRLCAATGKPVIISTGMATVAEIDAAVRAARNAGDGGVVVLSATTSYPAPVSQSNLRSLPLLVEMLHCPVGLSDHTPGIGAAVAAVALGAVLIEKHVTIDRASGGVDADFSLQPDELRQLRQESERAWSALGQARIGPRAAEEEGLRFRRSLYVVEDVRPGEVVSGENVRSIRPAGGLPPDEIRHVLGRRFRCDVSKGTPLTWDLI